jgi:RHS repeat-associated protein
VSQGSQTRTFVYDSLKRLTSATNPENGTTSWLYDANGNVKSRTQPGSVTTTWMYDGLNRMTSKTMPEGTASYNWNTPASHPSTNGIGSLASSSLGAFTTTWSSYDMLGRVTGQSQTVSGNQPYTFSYAYNAAGGLMTEQYPFGHVLGYCRDGAGEVTAVMPAAVDPSASCPTGNSNYADTVAYAPQGAVSSLRLGNGLWETAGFNARLQMTSMALGSAQNGEDKWKLTNTYSDTNNNGNILKQTLKTVPGTTVHEGYSYDGANRLTVAGEYPDTVTPPATPLCTDTGVRWCQGFTYDGAGNRKQTAAVGMTQSLLSPSSISSTNNRINATGWSYDTAGHGNVTKDPSNRTYAYDSENRMVAVCTSDPGGCVNAAGAGRTLYEYDADGRRVRKTDATGSTVYVYDAMGQLAAEYGGNQAGERSYLTADQLGSTRVISAADKTITACRDYTPFGEQVMPVSGDFRNSGCYAADAGVKQEFTGKERDSESGLDYFGARYFSAGQGRFMSPDPGNYGADARNPQTWNMYAYGLNNPVRYTDEDGMGVQVCLDNGNGGQNCVRLTDPQYAAAIAGDNPGVSAPGGPIPMGKIKCGGAVCGSAQYFEESMVDPVPGAIVAVEGARGYLSLGRSLFTGLVSLVRGSGIQALGLEGAAAAANAAHIARAAAARNAILAGSTGQTTIRGGYQLLRSGGATQAASDFRAVVDAGGATVRNYGPSVQAATLPDGSEVVLRQSTSKGFAGTPTLEFQDNIGQVLTKVRY